MNNWNLDDLYLGFDDHYKEDMAKLSNLVDAYKAFINAEDHTDLELVKGYIDFQEKIVILARSLSSYASLRMATDVSNQDAPVYLSMLQDIFRKSTVEDVKFTRYLSTLNLDDLAKHAHQIKQYLYLLKREQEDASHLLSENEEVLYSKLRELSSGSWGRLQGITTANLPVHFKEKEITLSEVRNLAYDYDKSVRKEAYQAELKAYETIDDQVALALSNIKREVTLMNELRGYESALEQTLFQSKMSKETLDAMISSMMDYRPHFEKYLKAKASYLGHSKGLPFYDLFAPVGKLEKTYTYEQAQTLVVEGFGSFSKKLSDFAAKAFQNQWIDAFPKKGKRGGAFCSNQPQIKQSRILSNFTGSLSDVLTLAHELGHGYHGDVISNNDPLHWSYPMPLAETASIFCETIVNNHLLSQITKPKERLSVLENALQGDTQVIIDILSRFIFESKLFEKATGPISKEQMKNMMIEAQKEAYLDGLDSDVLHPYMWLNKSHYYSAGLNFYNFPYAFGLLFGKGLYAQYLKDPESFVSKYNQLLSLTTKTCVEEVAKSMDIDVTKKEFWKDSLDQVKKDIDEVCELFSHK